MIRSINSMLASLNSFLDFMGWSECKVKNLRCQRQTYCAEDKELTKMEFTFAGCLKKSETAEYDTSDNMCNWN